jgi:hypothetical protein
LVEQAKAVDQSCNADGYLNNQSCNSDVSRESLEKMHNKDAFYGNLDPNEITFIATCSTIWFWGRKGKSRLGYFKNYLNKI